jgi:N6-L-threonylcarbamoyladenine synthase
MKNHTNKIILAIETSCDETAAAVLSVSKNSKTSFVETLSFVTKSQINLHKNMGGVVPETAARAHVKNILPVTKKALHDANVSLEKIDYIAVTTGPGLIPSLIVGVEFARSLAMAAKKLLIPVNHMAGHLYSPLEKIPTTKKLFPMVSLIVSGGHTMLAVMKNEKEYKVIGRTVDDAAGEAFDKVAKLLGLPYPGGPEVSKLGATGKPSINFPRPMLHSKDYNFSFSGLKTAVLYYVQAIPKAKLPGLKPDICASFELAAVDVLISKTLRAAKEYKAKSIAISGGVSANQKLRKEFSEAAAKEKLNCFISPLHLSTDNAEMIGFAAAVMLKNGFKPVSYEKVRANQNLEL